MNELLDTTGMMLGELKGQMGELIHNVNSLTLKVDGLVERVIGTSELPAKVKELEARIALLEAADQRRKGATGFAGMLLKSPALGWLVGAATSAWALLTGKAHL